jgi:Raf kinase inhibitor-like YbhB/YbcL family protein
MNRLKRILLLLIVCGLFPTSFGATAFDNTFKLISKDLVYFGTIPHRYTCKGLDISPPIGWEGVPDGTVTLAVCLENADTPTMHWIMWNIDPSIETLPEGVTADDIGALEGINDFSRTGYSGPCSVGTNEKYYITLYALSGKPNLASGATAKSFRSAISPLIIEEYTFVVFSMINQ